MKTSGEIKPQKRWLLVPVLLMVIGLVLVLLWISWFIRTIGDTATQIDYSDVFQAEKTGRYEIYYEYYISYNLDENYTFTFENLQTGQIVESSFPKGRVTYEIMDRKGLLIGVVQLEAGEYRIECVLELDRDLKFVINYGARMLNIFGGIFTLLGLGALLLASVTWIIVLLLKRSEARKRLAN